MAIIGGKIAFFAVATLQKISGSRNSRDFLTKTPEKPPEVPTAIAITRMCVISK
jgi:hypothetical protein